MYLGDLVRFSEKHRNGDRREMVGMVVEKTGRKHESIFRVKWFNNGEPDSWHTEPRTDVTVMDFEVISSIEEIK